MKKRVSTKDWLPLARTSRAPTEAPTGEAFRPEWIDFDKGIRVGNLEPHERITQILKYRLETEYGTPFVTDRWGRGVYWQWICWVPRADREAKPLSSSSNFGCAKLFISKDSTMKVFQCGLQVERGYVSGSPAMQGARLQKDWDWHRLMKQCAKGTALDEELGRLLRREGFVVAVEGEEGGATFGGRSFRDAGQIKEVARTAAPGRWAGFQLYYPMAASEVKASSGYELVQAVMGAFAEVVPSMNLCMQIALRPSRQAPPALQKAP
jgi:hypothetical protein